MFEKKLMLAGLKKQNQLLKELIGGLEAKSHLDSSDWNLYHQRSGQIARNLRKLRKFKKSYCRYAEPRVCPE